MTSAVPSLTTTTAEGVVDLPLSDVEVDVAVDSFGFTSIVTQVFGNDHEVPIEVHYTFPLPGGVAVNDCTIRIGDRVLQAELKEIGEARREYREAVEQGLTATIVEKELSEVFSVRVGNVAARSEVEVQLVLHGAVDIDEGEATLRFPAVVAPKYSSPDAAAESPDTRALPRVEGASSGVRTRFSIATADGTLPDGAVIRCTSHHDVGTGDGHRIEDIALDRDVVWRWPVATTTTQARWIADADDPEQGVVEVVVCESAPPTATRRPVDVTILLDRSGSMSGTGQVIGNGIAGDVLGSLSPGDTADVVPFDTEFEPLPACDLGPVPFGSPAFRRLIDEVGRVESGGGTELLGAIRFAAKRLPVERTERDRVMVIITDGHFGNESEAVRLRRTVLKGVRVVVLGVNLEMSGGFLKELANGSYVELINDERRRVEVSRRVCSRVTTPLHTSLQIEGVTDPASPDGIDVYPGALVRVAGRLRRPAAEVALVGPGGQRIVVPVRESTDGSVRTRWATSRLIVMEHEQVDRAQVVELSLRHRVLCKHTAWVVVDREGGRQDQPPVVVVPPVERMPWAAESMIALSLDSLVCANVLPSSSAPRANVRSVRSAPASAPRDPDGHWRTGRPVLSPRLAGRSARPRIAAPVPPVDLTELLTDCRQALADLRASLVVTTALVELIERCRPVLTPGLKRGLTRLGLDQLRGPVQQRTATRVEQLLSRVIAELEQALTTAVAP